ncbi:MAG: GNAT family N-acetyltransferase [Flavobacteriales bacterium]|nr:GNAT family N-acetyltransferase [Flavobacteriales bacterium]MCC6937350.1 GNAT family N-acetyltransferase [Flavobacteriales bacterium]
MKPELTVKHFDELTVRELHDILRLRVDVFVVEQACAYAEVDGKDPSAIHVMGWSDDELIACARILPPEEDGLPHVGRIVVAASHRGKGLAQRLMDRIMMTLNDTYGSKRSELAAQAHLQKFYERCGYVRVSEEYPWDGIPHVDMRHDAE